MKILVDYDNLPKVIKMRDVVQVVSYLIDTIANELRAGEEVLEFRLYGGWYSKGGLTRRAEEMLVQMRRNYPKARVDTRDNSKVVGKIHVSLASSLAAVPGIQLDDTYRQRELDVVKYKCNNSYMVGCADELCFADKMYKALETGCCPEDGCRVELRSMLSRFEQKMVDAMLVADMIYYAQIDRRRICLVSSDDDLIPGIMMVRLFGGEVLHVHTVKHGESAAKYTALFDSNYSLISLG